MLRKFPRPALLTTSVAVLLVGFSGAALVSEVGADNHASKAAQASAQSMSADVAADRADRATESSRSVEARTAVPHALSQALNEQNAQSRAVAEQKAQRRAEAEAAARKAAEEEAARQAAEEEAARKAAEEEAARKAAEQEAARKAAAEEAARKKAAEAPEWVGPVSNYRITAGFGKSGSRWASTHTGLDFAAPSGTKVRSVGSGQVIFAGWDGAYGNKIVVRHSNGTVTWYCHLSEFERSVGSSVDAGELIGRVGSTGNSTGPHLHLEVRPGGDSPVNPRTWLSDHGVNV